MTRQFKLSAEEMTIRLGNNGVQIRVESDNEGESGRLWVARKGVWWAPERAWANGPQSICIPWVDIRRVFAQYAGLSSEA